MKIYRSLSVLIIGILSAASSMSAQAYPTVLHIGAGVNSICPIGSCGVYNNQGKQEVNPFSDHLSLFHTPSKTDFYKGLYLLLGVVNDNSNGKAIQKSDFGQAKLWSNDGASSELTYGTFAFKGLMKSAGEAYKTAGLSTPNNSNNFQNWSGAEKSLLGIDAHNFGIYMLQLNVPALGPKDLVDIAFNNLPLGTFTLGYGEVSSGTESRTTYQGTAFTQSGLEVPPSSKVPEPSTLALLCLGFLGLVLMRRRSQQAG